ACGTVCGPVANGTAGCATGHCQVATCNTGFGNCDGNAANGCESNLQTDVNNCGACGTVCGPVANGTAGCATGHCQVATCNTGFRNCHGTAATGCESIPLPDVLTSGACGTVCGPVANGTAGCATGHCQVATCNTGFGNCDGNAANGCESNLQTDVNNCGAC